MAGVPLKLIVDLSNPGDEYPPWLCVGFWFVEELRVAMAAIPPRAKHHAGARASAMRKSGC
jgi:peptidyl-tRNA hydrolase